MSFEKIGSGVPKNGEPENPRRRMFLKGLVGGAALGALGAAGVNVYEHESDINQLNDYFKGKEGDIHAANEAASMLLEEMNVKNIERLALQSGTGIGLETARIDILRDFLTRHLQSPVGSKYPFQKDVIKSGVYTREILVEILSATTQ